MELDVAVRTADGVTVVDVAGEVDLYTAPRLEEALAKASGRTPPLIVVNLGRTTYLDSTALRVLTAMFKRVRERQGEMAIAEVQPKIAKLFTLTGLDQVLPICSTEREALEKVHQPPAAT
ncbi:MAG TPA: STAS domain-containing protein [bacterium]|nr:STAS domain-containing protein [bacterium]